MEGEQVARHRPGRCQRRLRLTQRIRVNIALTTNVEVSAMRWTTPGKNRTSAESGTLKKILEHNPECHEGHKMGLFSGPLASAWVGVRRANAGRATEEAG